MFSRRFVTVYNGPCHTYKVQRLSESTTYYFKIQACNDAGEGEFSEVYAFTTTKSPPASLKGEMTPPWNFCKPFTYEIHSSTSLSSQPGIFPGGSEQSLAALAFLWVQEGLCCPRASLWLCHPSQAGFFPPFATTKAFFRVICQSIEVRTACRQRRTQVIAPIFTF